MSNAAFSIKTAASQSGLTPFVIRAWERRYQVVQPIRTSSNQRRYTREHIERLTKLRLVIESGYRIGDIANLQDDELDKLVAKIPVKPVSIVSDDNFSEGLSRKEQPKKIPPLPRKTTVSPEEFIKRSHLLIDEMNEAGLESLLSSALVSLPTIAYLDRVVLPLTKQIGDNWESGKIRISQEHMATWVIKAILSGILRSYRVRKNSPVMLVTTPAGQLHEIGALAVAISGAHCGWEGIYLGPNLPAEEIAAAAIQTQANLVALSIIYPFDDPLLPDELTRLHHLLPRQVTVTAGGAASFSYSKTMESLGIINLFSLEKLRNYLKKFQA